MNIRNRKLYRKLNIYLDMGQSIAIINTTDKESNEAIRTFQDDLLKSEQTVYIDFKTISNPCSLARKIVYQCLNIITENTQTAISVDTEIDYSDDYYCLNAALLMPQLISEEIGKKIVFLCDNFTDILELEKGRQMQEHMRSVFQHQEDVHFIFQCRNKEDLNKIFMDLRAPFFRFAVIIRPEAE